MQQWGWNQMDKFKCNYNGMEKSFQNAAQMPCRKSVSAKKKKEKKTIK